MRQLLLHEFLLATAARCPGRAAVSHGGDSLTFGQVADGTRRFARALAAAGLRRGDRLAWWGGTDVDLVPLFFATASLGATFTPLNPDLTDDEARSLLDVADPRLVVVDEQHTGDLRLADLARSTVAAGLDPVDVEEADGHVLYFTSGTTGRPKAIELSHRTTMLRALPSLTELPEAPTVSMFPLFHMAGWSAAIGPWLSGDAVVLADGGDVEGLASALARHRARRFYAIPAVWRRLLDLGLDRFDLAALRHADTGTSATTPELLAAIHDALPRTTTTVTYGSTEAAGVCKLPFEDLARKPGSVGLPWSGVGVRLGDGELQVRSPFLFDGYFRDPAATAAAFTADGWYRTGELAAVDDEGYVSILGRVGDLIRSGGEAVAPAEVDAVLADHPAVLDVATAGVPDETWGEVVTAFVVARPGMLVTLDGIQRHCAGRLARYKVPRRLVVVDSIPRTGATRQVQRRLLTVGP